MLETERTSSSTPRKGGRANDCIDLNSKTTEKQSKDDGLKSKVLVEPKMILAESQPSALMAASMEIPTDKKDQLDQIEILMRPF